LWQLDVQNATRSVTLFSVSLTLGSLGWRIAESEISLSRVHIPETAKAGFL
jgi:hypothetical protein